MHQWPFPEAVVLAVLAGRDGTVLFSLLGSTNCSFQGAENVRTDRGPNASTTIGTRRDHESANEPGSELVPRITRPDNSRAKLGPAEK